MAREGYRWSFSLVMMVIQALILIPLAIYIGRTYSSALEIYHMVTRLILTIDANAALSEQNHALTMQKLQYENLQERIGKAGQACAPPYHNAHGYAQ